MTEPTDQLDKAIGLLNRWLENEQDPKQRLQITDRLLKALAMKYKMSDPGKGSKFGNVKKGT